MEIAPHYKPRATRSATYKQALSGPVAVYWLKKMLCY